MSCCTTGSLASSPFSAEVHGCGPGDQIRMFSGDDLKLTVTIRDAQEVPVDLTGATVHFQVRPDPDSVPVITKVSSVLTEINILPQAGDTIGQFELFILPVDTIDFDSVQYVYGITIVFADGTTKTAIQGGFIVTKRVVDLTAPPVTPGTPAPQTEAERSFLFTLPASSPLFSVTIPGSMIDTTYSVSYMYMAHPGTFERLYVVSRSTTAFVLATESGASLNAGAQLLLILRDTGETASSGVPHGVEEFKTATGITPNILYTFQHGAAAVVDVADDCTLNSASGGVTEIVAPDGFKALQFVASSFSRVRDSVPGTCHDWSGDLLFCGLLAPTGSGRAFGRNDADLDGFRLLVSGSDLQWSVRSGAGAVQALAQVALGPLPASGYYGFVCSLIQTGGNWTATLTLTSGTASDTKALTAEIAGVGFSVGAWHTATSFGGSWRLLAALKGSGVASVDQAALAATLEGMM